MPRWYSLDLLTNKGTSKQYFDTVSSVNKITMLLQKLGKRNEYIFGEFCVLEPTSDDRLQ